MDDFYKELENYNLDERELLVFKAMLASPRPEVAAFIHMNTASMLPHPTLIAAKYLATKIMRDSERSQDKKLEEYFFDEENYERIISKTKMLFDELKSNKSLDIAALFTVLAWKGYFSVDKHFEYGISNSFGCFGKVSHAIMSGTGGDAAFAGMLSDLLNEFNISNSKIFAEKKRDAVGDYAMPFKKNGYSEFYKEVGTVDPLFFVSKLAGNRAFNLIKGVSATYIFDAAAGSCYNIDDKNHAHSIVHGTKINLKPFFSYAFNSEKNEGALDHLITTPSFNSLCDSGVFHATMDYAVDLASDCQKVFDDFHDDIKKDIEEVNKAVQYIKGRRESKS